MPLPENKPNEAILETLASAQNFQSEVEAIKPLVEPRARAWVRKSFPGSKLFENRVQSLAHLISTLIAEELEKHGIIKP